MTPKNDKLLDLINLGAASVNILRAVGVNTYQELVEVGPVEAYCRMKLRGIHVSKVMLYALQGALLNIHWNDLEPDLKAKLVADADSLLAEAVEAE